MKYKLKEHVTSEMLREIGYRINYLYDNTIIHATHDEFDIFINLGEFVWRKNEILRNHNGYLTKKRLKHLVDLGYVEVVK
jgi:hypothetical protein